MSKLLLSVSLLLTYEACCAADATHFIQAAVDSLAERGGGTFSLPVGKYEIAGTIRLPVNVSIIGATTNSTSSEGVLIEHVPTESSDLFVADYEPTRGKYNQLGRIANLHCTGNKHSRYGLDLLKPQAVTIEHCTFDGFQAAGIRLRSAINTTIQNVNCNAGGSGVALDLAEQVGFIGTTVRVENCYLRLGDWALRMAPSSWYSVVFDGCIFESTKKGIIDIGAGCPGVTLDNCYSENIGTDGDGTSMIRVGVTAGKANKAAFAGKASILVNGGVYAAAYDGAAKRLFIESDASRSTIAQNLPVTNCNSGLLSTTVYTQDAVLDSVTTPQVEQENFGSIYDWKRVVANSIGNDLNPKGMRRSTATQLLSVGSASFKETSLDIPAGVRILGVSVYVKAPGITPKTWSAELTGGLDLPLLSGVSGDSNTAAAITLTRDAMTTAPTNVRLECESGNFTDGQVQVAVAYEYMHFQTASGKE